jgi:ABC-type Fe3+ transport system permease subunit
LLNTILGTELTLSSLLICSITSIILGLLVALTHKLTSKYNKNFLITLTIIPLMIEAIMIMVNGSLGTGIAVAGAFSLIRFRSVPGTSKEILSILISMTVGLVLGTGYVLFGVFIAISIPLYFLLIRFVNKALLKYAYKLDLKLEEQEKKLNIK